MLDASEKSHLAAVFVRMETRQKVMMQLVQCKTRVSPVKEGSDSSLRVVGSNYFGSRLFDSVKELFTESCKTYFWTDYTTAIAWLKRTEHCATFVTNREQ